MNACYYFYNMRTNEKNIKDIPIIGLSNVAGLIIMNVDIIIPIFNEVICINNWDATDEIHAFADDGSNVVKFKVHTCIRCMGLYN